MPLLGVSVDAGTAGSSSFLGDNGEGVVFVSGNAANTDEFA